MSTRLPAGAALGLKLVVTAALLGILWHKVDPGPALSRIAAIRPWAALGAVLLIGAQLALGSVRWQRIGALLGAPIRLARAFRFTLVGQFFNQVLPTALGGDAVRAWLAAQDGAAAGPAIRAVVCDRVAGLVVLLAIISASLFVTPRLADSSASMRHVLQVTAVLTVAGLAGLHAFGTAAAQRLQRRRWTRPIGWLVGDLRAALGGRATWAWTVGISLACHLIAVAAIWLCAAGMDIVLDPRAALSVLPMVILVSMAPISIAGWGLREGAMVVGLGLLGVAASDALSVSVAYGLVQVAAGAVGGAIWVAGPHRRTSVTD